MTMLSFKQVKSNCGKRESCERGYCWIIKFPHCLNFGYHRYGIIIFSIQTQNNYTLHAWKKKSMKLTTYDTFLRRVNFILMFFQGELASLLRAGKPFPGDLED